MRKNIVASSLLALASHASAQLAQATGGDEATFKLNIPANTASSGNGDIFFQISAPSSYEWIALGQGSRMAGSNIFVVYTRGDGNVTLSPRLATNYDLPNFNSGAEVALLEGSGVLDGRMVANVRCSNCASFDGADFTAGTGNWVWAFQSSGGPKDSDDTNAQIIKHEQRSTFQWNYANAKGGDSVNPLVNAQPSGTAGGGGATTCIPRAGAANTASGTASSSAATATQTNSDDDGDDDNTTTSFGRPTARPTARPNGPPGKRQELPYCDEDAASSDDSVTLGSFGPPENTRKMLIAHGTLAALAFVIFFPAGSIAIRLASFPGVIWLHAAFQVFAYLVYIVAFGLGVYIATEFNMLDKYHPIIGIVVFVALFFQPILGFLHHSLFKKYGTRTFWSYLHLWIGRLAITLGIINGGLGFMLADTMRMGSKSGMIVYSVVAAIIWLVWVAASIIGERRRKKAPAAPPKYSESPRSETAQRDIPHPENGHYAPR